MDLLLLAESPGFFTTLVSGFDPGQRFVLTIIGIGCVTLAVVVISAVSVAAWCSVRESEQRAELTRNLLDQGKSAEEIERILKPSSGFERSMQSWFGGCRTKT